MTTDSWSHNVHKDESTIFGTNERLLVEKHLDDGKVAVLALLDLSTAFDTIEHLAALTRACIWHYRSSIVVDSFVSL